MLCDSTSVCCEGLTCPLAKRGHARDGKQGQLPFGFALVCDQQGCPVAVEVCAGNTADPGPVAAQIQTLRDRFSRSRIVLAGERGLLNAARTRDELAAAGRDWIPASRAPAIQSLVQNGAVAPALLDERDLAEIPSPEPDPGARLVVCRNPLLAAQRAQTRPALLAATEAALDQVLAAPTRKQQPLRGQHNMAVRVDCVLRKCKVGQHFDVQFTDDSCSGQRSA